MSIIWGPLVKELMDDNWGLDLDLINLTASIAPLEHAKVPVAGTLVIVYDIGHVKLHRRLRARSCSSYSEYRSTRNLEYRLSISSNQMTVAFISLQEVYREHL